MMAPPMIHALRSRAKVAVAKVGRTGTRLDVLYNLPKVEAWRRANVPDDCPAFDHRLQLHDHVQKTAVGDKPVDYLEFGVFMGESLRHWIALNTHAESRFVGFDTFEGLPEDWLRFSDIGARTFDVHGGTPDIDDTRVEFVKGLFQDTLMGFLEGYQPQPDAQFVLHMDADIYSSTLYVLTRLDDLLVPGSIVVFDEFSSVLNEFAALRDYCSAYRRSYEVIGVTNEYFAQVAIRML